jgi:hypothetical protein
VRGREQNREGGAPDTLSEDAASDAILINAALGTESMKESVLVELTRALSALVDKQE